MHTITNPSLTQNLEQNFRPESIRRVFIDECNTIPSKTVDIPEEADGYNELDNLNYVINPLMFLRYTCHCKVFHSWQLYGFVAPKCNREIWNKLPKQSHKTKIFYEAIFAKSHSALCSKDVPITSKLFGDDLTKRVKELSDANQMFSTHGYRGRNRGIFYAILTINTSRGSTHREGVVHEAIWALAIWVRNPLRLLRPGTSRSVQGLKIDFDSTLEQEKLPGEIPFTNDETQLKDIEIEDLILK
ncbi:hypothetical protein KUTeg_015923, partial [Tegillarca granosa]